MAYEFFNGYVKTKNKKPDGRFKEVRDRLTLDVAQRLDEYAGVLAYDTAIVDIDNAEDAKTCLKIIKALDVKCRVVKTTRGMHFYFKNSKTREKKNSSHMCSAVGLTVDYRVGCERKAAIVVLKQGGVMREVIRDTEHPDEIPCWLLTVGKETNWHLSEGEGRNDALYRHTKTLARIGLTPDEIQLTCELINQYVFRDPLDDSELATVTREQEGLLPPFFDPKGKFLHYDFAKYYWQTYDVCVINSKLRRRTGYIYSGDPLAVESGMYDLISGLSSTQRNEVLKDMRLRAPQKQTSPARYMAFKNCVVDLLTGRTLTDNEAKDLVILNQIPHAYNPHAKSQMVDTLLNNLTCGDAELKDLICEMIGACMYPDNRIGGGKAFILTGTGANGKSTLLDLLQDLLGEDNVTTLDLKKLSDRFSTTMLEGKLCDLGDDISSEFLADTSYFKRIVTGQTLDAEEKGKPKYTFRPYCKLIFSVNEIPRIGRAEERDAIIRRMVIVPFNAQFKRGMEGYDPNIGDTLRSQESTYEYLINLGIDGLQRVYSSKGFTQSGAVDAMIEDYKRIVDPMIEYLEDKSVEDFVGRASAVCYADYTFWCAESGYIACSLAKFSRGINREYNLTTEPSGGKRTFTRKES